ncbi:MAG: permease prefix domain 1-containing protein [Actinomycetota bacterium]
MRINERIDQIVKGLGIEPQAEESLRLELSSHFKESIDQYREEGLSEDCAVEQALRDFGQPDKIRRQLKQTYSEVYLMSTIGRVIYSKPAVGTGMVLATLAALVFVIWGGSGVYQLTKLPPSPTAWHDADSTPLFMVAFAIPMLVLFGGTIVRWIRTKVMPDRLLIWTAGLMVFLFILADLAVK